MCRSLGDQRETLKHVGQPGGETPDAADFGSPVAEWWRSLESTSPEQSTMLGRGGDDINIISNGDDYAGGGGLHPCDCHRDPPEDHARDAFEGGSNAKHHGLGETAVATKP